MSLLGEGSGMNRTIFQGDVLEKLAEIESESIDCIISSPPYWGLRDYGVGGQLGLEPDFRDYLKTMNDIMVQLKRVLKNTGTCWINLGDTYGYNSGKSRYGIPERFYINCIDDGWIARNHIPWYKANSMPSSVKDRFTNKWESIFFFAKQQKYYFDLDSVREQLLGKESKPFNIRVRDAKNGYLQQKFGEKYKASKKEIENYDDDHITKKTRKILNIGGIINEKYKEIPQSNVARLHRNRPGNPNNRKEGKADWVSGFDEYGNCYGCGKPKSKHRSGHDKNINNGDTAEFTPCNPKGKNPGDVFFIDEETTLKLKDHYDNNGNCLGCGKHFTKHAVSKRAQGSENRDERQKVDYVWCNARGKNPGDVFFINPKPFPEAHFATFPVELPTKILKCACPKDGIVLDPFLGSGTVGIAAEQLGLKWCGIELNEEYITLARKRLDPFRNDSLEMFT